MPKKPVAKLRIAKGLSLGLDAVTKTFAILAQRRKGKTYTASVMAEEMVKAGIPWVALDPTGAWWGLRARDRVLGRAGHSDRRADAVALDKAADDLGALLSGQPVHTDHFA